MPMTEKQWKAFYELRAEVEDENTKSYTRAVRRMTELYEQVARLEEEIEELAEKSNLYAWRTLLDNADVLEELGIEVDLNK